MAPIAPLLVASLALWQGDPPAPSGAPAPGATPLPAATPDTAPEAAVETGLRLQGPIELPETRKIEVRRRLVSTVEKLRGNVVQLSIERCVGDNVFVSLEASGLVVDPKGHVITIGSTLEQAGRVAVRFPYVPGMPPRRAWVVGVDEKADVGVLDVGSVRLPALDLSTAFVPPAPTSETRYVVTLCAVPDEQEGRVAAGWLHDPLQNPTLGRMRFDFLLRVATSRAPQCAGGVLAQQDGHVVGLMLAPAQATGGAVPTDGMLAVPADAVRRGMQAVLSRPAPPAPADVTTVHPRAWIGFGATDLEEPEFLRQLGVEHAVVVSEVFDASPALAAGLAPHDVIVKWDGKPVTGVDGLYALLAASAPGRVVALDTVRGLDRRKASVTLGAW